jgi:pimeloyl-ACP methyl ester carboxylesterase
MVAIQASQVGEGRDSRRCNGGGRMARGWIMTGCLLAFAGHASQAATASGKIDAKRCESLAGMKMSAPAIGLPTMGARVESAAWVPAGATGNANGDYCLVKGAILPTTSAPNILFEVNLPGVWNTKVLQMGGGGFDGSVVTGLAGEGLQPATLGTPLERGYVTAGSDGGHEGGPGFDGTFGLNDEALLNYGQQSVKKVHDATSAIVEAGYGRRPRRFYFIGNSQGGHEALDAAARYPQDYDGVVANYPAYNVTMLHFASLNVAKALYANGGAGWINAAKTKLLTTAVRASCDSLDGVEDGVISNVPACHAAFSIATVRSTLRCAGGADTGDGCLSDAQIDAVDKISSSYRPGFSIAGADVFPPWALLEGSRFEISNFGSRPMPTNPPTNADALLYNAGAATSKYIITRNPMLDALTFNPLEWVARTQAVGRIMDVTDVDLSPFRRRGGKIIITHGTEDDFISPHNSDAYYERHLALQGRKAMDEFVRFYKIPGFSHGFGSFNAKYDGLGALDAWVEQARAPGELIATDANPGAANRTRPMCRYPMWPRYTSGTSGSPNDAASFTCVSP